MYSKFCRGALSVGLRVGVAVTLSAFGLRAHAHNNITDETGTLYYCSSPYETVFNAAYVGDTNDVNKIKQNAIDRCNAYVSSIRPHTKTTLQWYGTTPTTLGSQVGIWRCWKTDQGSHAEHAYLLDYSGIVERCVNPKYYVSAPIPDTPNMGPPEECDSCAVGNPIVTRHAGCAFESVLIT